MSYRLEHEPGTPKGVEAIVISGWNDGISADPYKGVNNMLNVNLSVPGEVAVGYPITTSVQSGATMQAPIHRTTQYSNGVATAYYILDFTSKVFKSTSYSGTWTFLTTSNSTTGASATNQGLVYWIPRSGGNGILFKFRDSHIDYLVGGSGTWVANWKPSDGTTTATGIIVSGVNHYAIAGQDGAVYFCNGSGIGSIMEVDGQIFNPTNPATYSFTALDPNNLTTTSNAVPIASYDTAQSLAEQGTTLLIGGSLNAIYPWDRISPQVSYPIFIGDVFIGKMVTVNTNVYIYPGNNTGRGKIYVTNGSQANLFFKIPDYLFGEQDPYFLWGDAIFHRNNLIFGFFIAKNDGSGNIGNSSIGTAEVWAFDLETEAFRGLSQLSTGNAKYNPQVLIAAQDANVAPGMGYIVAAAVSGGGDAILGYSGTTSGVGTFSVNTDIIPVGTLFDKRTFTQVEYKLRSPLATGESLVVKSIVDGVLNTNPLVFSPVSVAGEISGVAPVDWEKAQWIQFNLSGTGNSASSGVRLREIRIR